MRFVIGLKNIVPEVNFHIMIIVALLFLTLSEGQAESVRNPIATLYYNKVNAGECARKSPTGIIIAGKGAGLRALEPFCGNAEVGLEYSAAVNRYCDEFGVDVQVYCMVIPTAVEFYCPDAAKMWTREELPVINSIYSCLAESVRTVDVYSTLAAHAHEGIYSRTDHHWAPLGAYYAAREFAMLAGVPFRELTDYDRKTVGNYVGTMYRFSKDRAVKDSPEEFVYYVPRGVDYTTTFVCYALDKSRRRVVSETLPSEGAFFKEYGDGSSGAYCTFMGGDTRLTKVATSTKNGRKLLILKDSFGNAIPGYLFYSFEEIHVVDCRYFTKNMRIYVRENRITDILFANNIGHACQDRTSESYIKYLGQR